MRMINRIKRIHGIRSQRFVYLVHIGEMIHVRRVRRVRRDLRVFDEPRRVIHESACFPGVIGRLRRDDDGRADFFECIGGVLEVCREGEDGFIDAVVFRVAYFGARAGTVGAAVVAGRAERAAVVVTELDDHVVARFKGAGDVVKPAFARVGPCAAPGYGLVGYGDAA